MELPNSNNIGKFAILVDTIDFATILRYYESPTSEISAIVLLDDTLTLPEFAATAKLAATTVTCHRRLIKWREEGTVKLLDNATGNAGFSATSIHPEQAVACLYLPPAYAIQIRN